MKRWQDITITALTVAIGFGSVALVVLAFLRYGYLVAWIIAAALFVPAGLLSVSRWPWSTHRRPRSVSRPD